ncbi:unnamed protein product, partial [Ixodes persulcatus]
SWLKASSHEESRHSLWDMKLLSAEAPPSALSGPPDTSLVAPFPGRTGLSPTGDPSGDGADCGEQPSSPITALASPLSTTTGSAKGGARLDSATSGKPPGASSSELVGEGASGVGEGTGLGSVFILASSLRFRPFTRLPKFLYACTVNAS